METNDSDSQPPHSPEAERAVLNCIVDAGISGSQAEVEAQLQQLKPSLFYDLRHRNLYSVMVQMRMDRHAVELTTLGVWLKTNQKLEECGGDAYVFGTVLGQGFLFTAFPDYCRTLKSLALRRWALQESARLRASAELGDIDVSKLREELSTALETVDKATDRERPVLEILTVDEIMNHVPDPKVFLLGDGMIALGEVCVIAGLPGLGKSRLATTLAVAGAAGKGEWMGYTIRRQFRTLILQVENSVVRMKSEIADIHGQIRECVRFSEPRAILFSSPQYRQALRRYWETWPFDLIVIDAWSNVVKDDKFSDYRESLDDVMAALPGGDDRPAIAIVAHLKKSVLQDKRLTGRQLMGQVSGSMKLMQTARTAFMLQPASEDIEDDRVVFDCGKCNNDQPLPMSAWHRRNGQFLPCPGFDFEEWLYPPEESRKAVTEADMVALFKDGRRASKKILADELMERGFSQATAYRYLDMTKSKFRDFLEITPDGLLAWKG